MAGRCPAIAAQPNRGNRVNVQYRLGRRRHAQRATGGGRTLAVMRLLTGLGLGGAMPNTIALTAEFSPASKRASAVTINFVTFSVGAAVGGLITAQLMPSHGWASVFWVCGGMAVALVPLLIFAMPESYRPERGKMAIPIGDLFRDGRAQVTALLWFLFFLNLMELY